MVLSGSLEEVPLPDIARLFQSTRKTGRLELVSGQSSGHIFFNRGDIVDCQSANQSGIDALKHVALFNRGTFDFQEGQTPTSQTLVGTPTNELIEILEMRMMESRQLQELVPAVEEIPRYLGGALPAELELGAADLAIALKASTGNLSVRRLTIALSLDEMMVRYTIARFRAAGLMEIVGVEENIPDLPTPSSSSAAAPTAQNGTAPASTGPRYWRGRKVEG